MKVLNQIIEDIMENENLCKEYSEKFTSGSEIVFSHNVATDEKLLIRLINESGRRRALAQFLSDIIIYFNKIDITNKVFDRLINYKGSFRKSILIGLAHCDLSFYQLCELNKLNIDGNPFCRLLKIYVTNDIFSQYDLKKFIDDNANMDKESCIYVLDHIPTANVTPEKKKIIADSIGYVFN